LLRLGFPNIINTNKPTTPTNCSLCEQRIVSHTHLLIIYIFLIVDPAPPRQSIAIRVRRCIGLNPKSRESHASARMAMPRQILAKA
jgi:hypothetical protein